MVLDVAGATTFTVPESVGAGALAPEPDGAGAGAVLQDCRRERQDTMSCTEAGSASGLSKADAFRVSIPTCWTGCRRRCTRQRRFGCNAERPMRITAPPPPTAVSYECAQKSYS